MDALFHLVCSLAGSYILVKGIRLEYGIMQIAALSIFSLSMDMDHFTGFFIAPGAFSSHCLLFAFFPVLLYGVFHFLKLFSGLHMALLILSALFLGHLSADMIGGLYGVPLFFPFSHTLYMIPDNWEYILPGSDGPAVSTPGIGLTLYFGLIGVILSISDFLRKRSNKKF